MKKNLLLFICLAISNLVIAQYEFTSIHASEMTTASVAFKAVGVDSDENIWIGTVTSKILRYDGTEWITYGNDVLNLDGTVFINNIYEDPQGRVWFMTNGGITYFQNDTWTTFTTANGLEKNTVHSATFYDGKMYFSVSGGVMIYDDVNWTYNQIPNAFSTKSDLAVDVDNKLWVTFKQHASSYRLNNNQWEAFDLSNSGICSEDITGVHPTPSGDLWFYDKNGDVCIYDGTDFTSNEDLAGWGNGMGSNITAIASTANSPEELWISADGIGSNGIAHRKDNVNTYYGPSQGVQSNWIQSIAVNGSGTKVYAITASLLLTGTSTAVSNTTTFAEANLSVYPNPTDGKVYLKDEMQLLAEDCQLEIFSADGRRLMNKSQNKEEGIDLSTYPKGWYFMRFSSDEITVAGVRVFRK